jgi:hypothetical protein
MAIMLAALPGGARGVGGFALQFPVIGESTVV